VNIPKGTLAAVSGLSLSGLGLYVAFRGLALADVGRSLGTLHVPPLLFAAVPIATGAALRALRWNVLARSRSFGPSLETVCVSAFFNGILPLRAGEVLRPLYFARRTGSPLANAVAATLAERILDLVTLAAFGAFLFSGSTFGQRVPTLVLVGGAAALLALAALGTTRLRGGSLRPDASRGMRFLAETVRALSVAGSPSRLGAAVTLSAAMWLVTAWPFVLGLEAAGVQASFRDGVWILLAVTFAIALPSSPGFFGTFHAGFVLGAGALGILESRALPAAIATHLLLQIPFVLAGAVILAAGGRRLLTGRQGDADIPEDERLS